MGFGKRRTRKKDRPAKQSAAGRRDKPGSRGFLSVQGMIGFESVAASGLCWLGGDRYSVCLRLSDINYCLAPGSVQEGLVEKYARFLNSFTPEIHLQLFLANRRIGGKLADSVELPRRGDGFDFLRKEYAAVFADALDVSANVVTEKYVVLSVRAEGVEDARGLLDNAVASLSVLLKEVGGCEARRLGGEEYVHLLQYFLYPGRFLPFSYRELVAQSMSVKDMICPQSLTSDPLGVCVSGEDTAFNRVFVCRRLPAYLSDQIFKEIMAAPVDVGISVHVDPIDQVKGLSLVKRQIASMDMQRESGIRKLARQGLSDDFLSHELVSSYGEATALRQRLETSNEKLFDVCFLVRVGGKTKEEAEQNTAKIKKIASKHSLSLENLKYMQLPGFNACLPLGVCSLPVRCTYTTSMLSILMPFTTPEIQDAAGLFYGTNTLSKNVIVADKKAQMNANAFILGTTGSGKSLAAKFEIAQCFLKNTRDQILVIDPEKEYRALGEALSATVVKISASSPDTINPLHMGQMDNAKDKSGFALSVMELLLGGESGFSPAQRSIADRCISIVYRDFEAAGENAAQPTLLTLFEVLRIQEEKEARELAAGLELYAKGSLAGFARESNVDLSGRLIVYDLSEAGKSMTTFAMMVVLDNIWSRILENQANGIRTWVYADEFHLLFANRYASRYFLSLYKRVRKYGAGITGITQNIEELLENADARLMLANANNLLLLNQEQTDAATLSGLLNLSKQQTGFITNARPGTGLIKIGASIIPFSNRINPAGRLYRLFSTSFGSEDGRENDE